MSVSRPHPQPQLCPRLQQHPPLSEKTPQRWPFIFIIAIRTPAGGHGLRTFSVWIVWDTASLCICSIRRRFHTEHRPHSHFTWVSRFGPAVWWCCVTTHTYTHTCARTRIRQRCHPRKGSFGKNLKFQYCYSTQWVSALTRRWGLCHRVRSSLQPYAQMYLA